MTKKILSFYIILNFSLSVEAFAQKLPYSLNFEIDVQGLKFEGMKLNGNGLYLAKYFYVNGLFHKPGFEYDSVIVPLNKLDPRGLYRLKMFLITHDYLKNIRGFPGDEWSDKPDVFIINKVDDNYRKIIYDYELSEDQCYDVDRYLLSELQYLLNNLVPIKYEKFVIPAYYCSE